MLEIVKDSLESLPNEPFSMFFTKYVIQVQDLNIQEEFKYFTTHNLLSTLLIQAEINRVQESMVRR